MARLILSEDFIGARVTSPYLEHIASVPEIYEADNQLDFVSCPGRSAGHYYAKEGTNEETPWEVILNSEELTRLGITDSFYEFCFEWQEFFQTGYGWPSSGQKMFRALYDNSNVPESKKSTELATLNDNVNVQYAAYWDRADGSLGEWAQNSGEPHPENSWVTWRVWLKLNDQGSSNGFIRVFRNGEQKFNGENLVLRDDNNPHGYNIWWVGGNYSMIGGVGGLPRTGHRYVTGIRWWDTFPD